MRISNKLTKQSGFTLLELMVVIGIVGFIVAFFMVSMGGLWSKTTIKETETRLQTLANLVADYRSIEGQFPDDRLPGNHPGGTMNAKAEALFLAFYAVGYTGQLPNEQWLVNTDGDSSAKSVSRLPKSEIFEIGDAWGNPILYFESLHYKDSASVMAGEDGMFFEQVAYAGKSETTGAYVNANGFQLVSAGPDCEFGTEDDISKP